MRKPKVLHNFYKSLAWQIARTVKIEATQGKCERCGGIGEEVHHKIRLTVDNVNDTNISLNQDNLEFLCKKCHNAEHKRFSKEREFDEEGNYISR
ncbi:MAG: HNH endonuclease [Acholeplasmatales bacterium]|jgi:5-methylcytosine-specific restriction endonuclease McrA